CIPYSIYAEFQGDDALVGSVGDGDDAARLADGAKGGDGEQAHRAAADDEYAGRSHAVESTQHAMQGTAERLDEHRGVVRYGVGDLVQLDFVRDEGVGPAAAGVTAVAGLHAGADVARGHVDAVAVVAGLA